MSAFLRLYEKCVMQLLEGSLGIENFVEAIKHKARPAEVTARSPGIGQEFHLSPCKGSYQFPYRPSPQAVSLKSRSAMRNLLIMIHTLMGHVITLANTHAQG